MRHHMKHLLAILLVAAPLTTAGSALPTDPSTDGEDIKHSPEVHVVDYDGSGFRPDPAGARPFDPEEQWEIYGGKYPVTTQRPLLELGRQLYVQGPFQPGIDTLGEKNLIWPWLMVFGDWRVAYGQNDRGNQVAANEEVGSIATQLTLDIDIKLTATERIHLITRPFEKGGDFSRWQLRGDSDGDAVDDKGKFDGDVELDGNLDAAFFEGDLGALMTGFTGRESTWDLPFAFGFIPLLVQNGVWIEDAFKGFAFTIPAKNSKALNISNYDVTFFAAFDDVTSGAAPGTEESDVAILGVNTFIDANEGYWEAGYGFTNIADGAQTGNGDLDYHNVTVAFTRRYGSYVSNSVRGIWNFGQDASSKTADGFLLLIENSLITSKPSTLIPYANLFVGFNRPQSLARAGAAGGVLKNTGINFETDGLTGFPKLTDTGHDAYGGALGLEYLFNLDKQVVFEIAGQREHGSKNTMIGGTELAAGVRVQYPISHRFIIRADAILGHMRSEEDLAGIRLEFRWKF